MLDNLKKLGLSENEAKVYLAMMELGSSAVQKISQKAGLKRPTTYVQIESLMKRGLATSFEKGNKTLFRAEDPENLRQVLEKDKEEQAQKTDILEKILPGLGNLYLSSGERPRVRFFEGMEGLKTIQDEFLKSGAKEIKSFMNIDDVFNVFPSHTQEYTPKRVQKGIKSKLIYTSQNGDVLKETDAQLLRESKFIPKEKFPFSGNLAIHQNNVSISVHQKRPFGVIIESEDIAKSMGVVFDLLWEKL